MIELWAKQLAEKIKAANPEETHSVEVMKYSLSIIINFIGVLAASSVIGTMMGEFRDTIMTFASFFLLRSVSGGSHMSSLFKCFVVSTLLISVIPHIPITASFVWVINTISLILVSFLAPSSNEKNRIPKSAYPYLKVASIIFVCFSFVLNSTTISLAFLSQAILLLPGGRWKKL